MTVVTRSAPRKTWGLPGPRRVLQEHGQQVGWGATGPGLPHGHFGGSSHEPQLGSNHSYNPFINGTTHLGDLLLGLECPEKCTDSEKKSNNKLTQKNNQKTHRKKKQLENIDSTEDSKKQRKNKLAATC